MPFKNIQWRTVLSDIFSNTSNNIDKHYTSKLSQRWINLPKTIYQVCSGTRNKSNSSTLKPVLFHSTTDNVCPPNYYNIFHWSTSNAAGSTWGTLYKLSRNFTLQNYPKSQVLLIPLHRWGNKLTSSINLRRFQNASQVPHYITKSLPSQLNLKKFFYSFQFVFHNIQVKSYYITIKHLSVEHYTKTKWIPFRS